MFPVWIFASGGRPLGVLTAAALTSAGVQLLLMRIE